MLPENQQVKSDYIKKNASFLSEPRNIRIRFRKVGNLQYISHLDLQRTMHRILSRAGIPVWYSKGFNPHIKIVFSTPLSIGTQSECEMLDIRIEREISCEEIKKLLNAQVTEEMKILDVYVPTTKFSEYVWAGYQMEMCCDGLSQETADEMNRLMSSPVVMAKKTTKSGEKEFNIIPLVRSFNTYFDKESNTVKIETVLNVSNEGYLNPALLLDLLMEKSHIDKTQEDRLWFTIVRTEAFCDDGLTQFK